ncbi:MAG TPA: lysyl oxidase family protein [Verrucomicrobiales bacterium]|nr:lysyl oxidase family protein [Verrucomicrobiales bacterium]
MKTVLLRALFMVLFTAGGAIAAPVNDNFASAAAINTTSGAITSTNNLATAEAGEPAHAGEGATTSVWYRFTPPVAMQAIFHTESGSTNFDTLLAVYSGSAVNSLTEVTSNDDSSGSKSRVTFAAAAGVTYYIAVDGYQGATGTFVLTWSQAPVTNDNFASATLLTGRTGSVTGFNTGATAQADEPHAGNSVWYRWTAPSAYPAFFKTTGSSFDTVVTVYTGSALTALTQVATNDNDASAVTSRVEFPAAAGTTYRIQVKGATAADAGGIRLLWGDVNTENAYLLPDLFVLADQAEDYLYGWYLDQTQIPGRTLMRLSTATPNIGAGPLELRGSSTSPGVVQRIFHGDGTYHERLAGTFTFHPGHGHLHFDDWVQFRLRAVLPGNGVGDVIATGSKTSFAIIDLETHDSSLPGYPSTGTYSGGLVQGLSVGWRDIYTANLEGQWIDVTAVQPGQYWLEGIVDPDNHIEESDETNNVTRILVTYAGTVPPNNTFSSATVLTGTTTGSDGRTISATKQSGEPLHAGNAGGASIWYRWQAVTAGPVVVTTEGSNFDTLLGVYTGSSVSGLTTIASNDDNAPLITSRLTFNAVAGTTYYIAVDGKNGASGLVELAINPAKNDNFADALVLTGTTGTSAGSTRGATHETGEPAHAGAATTQSIWYRLTPTLTGDAAINTLGSTFDTKLAVYTGASVEALTLVASDDDGALNHTSRVNFHVTSGTPYYIAIDGPTGIARLQWTVSTAIAPVIVTQPESYNPVAGSTVSLHVGASGSPALVYEWRHAGELLTDGGRVTGATTDTLMISKAGIIDSGGYQCTVTNPAGSAVSNTATVLVVTNARVLYADYASGDIGGQVGVPLLLQSQGNENSLSFTVSFDPAILSQPAIQAGPDATGATFTLDRSQEPAGRFGVTLALPASTAFTSGLREVARLTFHSAAGTPNGTVTPVGFTSAPVSGRGYSTSGAVLPTVFAAGNLTLGTVSEQLLGTIMEGGGIHLHLRGITGRTYKLQKTEDLTTWTEVDSVEINQQGEATASDAGGTVGPRRFYRAVLEP